MQQPTQPPQPPQPPPIRPLFHVDKRSGSNALPPYLKALGAEVQELPNGLCNTDIEFLGHTSLGPCTPIGIEHKSAVTGDAFTSMTNGRLTGKQMLDLVEHYPAIRYIIIEGPKRRVKDGRLEVLRAGEWRTAYSRNGAGWTYREFKNRIESIEEFWSWPHCAGRTRVVETYDVYESAAFIVDRWHYWNKPYDEHSSARQRDTSQRVREQISNPITRATRDVKLAQLWAADIDGIGDKISAFVARHFKSGRALATATEEEWAQVEWKVGKALRPRHFSKETVRNIIRQITEE